MKAAPLKINLLSALCLTLAVPFMAEEANAHNHMDRWGSQWSHHGMRGQGMGMNRQSMARHRAFMRSGVPSPYAGSQNPYSQTPEAIRAGGSLYQQQCAVCHGVQGMGDGVAANSLTPPPSVLDKLIQMPMSVDEYLLWSISEGGKPFGTDMPAFKEQLSENDIWKIVAYMRAGFPSTTDSDPH